MKHPCKSTVSNRYGNVLPETKEVKANKQVIIVIPTVRIYKMNEYSLLLKMIDKTKINCNLNVILSMEYFPHCKPTQEELYQLRL